MQQFHSETPVVVLKSVAHGGLGIVRSLGRLGVDVYTVEADPKTPAFYSRYNRGSFRLDIETAAADDSLARLQELSRRIGKRAILIPSTDYAAIFIAEHAHKLKSSFLFPRQSPELLRKLYSKREMHFLAKAHGLPTPEACFPKGREEVVDFATSARFPLVLKAIDGTRLNARCGKKMFIVQDANELLTLYDTVEDSANPNLMLQEYIAGEDDSIWMFDGYFDANSQPRFASVAKKLRQCPAFSGYTCLGEIVDNDEVKHSAIRFLQALGYSGLVDIDFRYDPRDGKYKVLDVNPRMGATFRLFTSPDGLDLARTYYLDLTGQSVPTSSPVAGRKWMVGDLDAVSSMRYYRRGQLTLKAWLQSVRRVEETAFWASDDPLPFFARLSADAIEALKRAISRTRRRGTQQASQPMRQLPQATTEAA